MFDLNSVRTAPGLRSSVAVAAVLTLCSASQARASDEAVVPVVVTATRLAQPLNEVLADVSIIDREAIERQVGGAVADVLRGLPGIELTQNGGSSGTTKVLLRGADNRHVLVLIDGVPFESQSVGGTTWEALPLQMVDHIEVLRGPASAAYGSGAIAGVIQIFTRKGSGVPRWSLGVGMGDQGFLNTDIGVLGSVGALDYSVTAATERNDGFNTRATAVAGTMAADRDGSASSSANVSLGYQLSTTQRLRLGVLNQHLNSQYDASTKSKYDDHAIKDLSSANASWTAQWLPDWQSVLALGQSTDNYETRPAGYHSSTRVQTASLINQVVLGEHTLRATVERREDHLLNSSLPLSATAGKGDRSDNGVGLGYDWRHDALSLASSIRLDNDSSFGEHVTGSLAGGINISPSLRAVASWGTAYKAPTLYQRFGSSGNPDLVDESSRASELGLKYSQGVLSLGATVYDTHVANFISYSTPGVCVDTGGCYRNTSRVELKGIEFQAATTVSAVRLSGSVDFSTPKDLDTDLLLQRRARQHGSVKAETDLGNWAVALQAQANGRRYDDVKNTIKLGGYTVWGVSASRTLALDWRLIARVENLSDARYQTASGYASSSRAFFLGVRWTPSN
jgi:vitamin B12 transporter